MAKSLTKLSLIEISRQFSKEDEFYFERLEGHMMVWWTKKDGLTYEIEFFINEFSTLTQPCDIDALIAAIDESRHFGVRVTF